MIFYGLIILTRYHFFPNLLLKEKVILRFFLNTNCNYCKIQKTSPIFKKEILKVCRINLLIFSVASSLDCTSVIRKLLRTSKSNSLPCPGLNPKWLHTYLIESVDISFRTGVGDKVPILQVVLLFRMQLWPVAHFFSLAFG